MKRIFVFIITIFLVFSCSNKEEKLSAENSYIQAMKQLKKKNYSSAAEKFDKIDDDFPFSKWALKGQAMAVYAYYKNEGYDNVLHTTEDFIRLNPSNEYVPYMLYMRGIAYYDKIPQINRSQKDTQLASYIFRELLIKFPQSNYAEDAKDKIFFIDEHLAGSKMSIGRYQTKIKNYVGAIHAFKEVTDRYRYTKQVPEAYFRLAEIYYKIGLKNESQKIIDQLLKKFPDNYWTELAKKIDEKR
jgi:outer membrane protein assembly factor BamD